MAEGGGSGGGRPPSPSFRESPPKAIIDTSPIQMDQNKESLKVKLLLRRPLDQLVAQGIMPPHGSRRSVERAKTGDILKAKIQQRPPRQELERRHILEADALHADPSLAERQRMLKKARLADQLNDQLSHRPGPLELIQKNILHTEEPIEQAVKTGQIPYKATSEGALKRPQHPLNYINPEEDSQGSSEGDATAGGSPASSDVLETAAKSAGIVVSLIQPVTLNKDSNSGDVVFADLCRPLLSSPGGVSSTSTLSPLSSVASPQPPTPAPPPPPPLPLSARKCDAPGKDKNKKKSKKSTPKARTIKFHEYKGPPSAQKSSSNNNPTLPNGESSYDLLLQQQTLLLQFQLQLQHKFPKIILPGPPQKIPSPPEQPPINLNVQQPSPSPSTSSESSVPSQRKLEDMKVSDLKAELKRRSLPVSGCKPQLIERLKSHQTTDNPSSVESETEPDSSPPPMEIGEPLSPAQQQHQEDLVREQQRQIQELQRELTLSQLKLQALNSTRSESQNTQLLLQKHLQARQQQQNIALQVKQLQAETKVNNDATQQKLQQQHVAFQNLKNRSEPNKLGFLVNNAGDLQVYQLMQCKNPPQIVLASDVKEEKSPPQIKIEYRDVSETPKPPPLYTDKKKSTVKSQIVDDVLEILIKNGELPPSAASYPSTPGSANQTKPEPPYFPHKWEPNQVDLDNNIQMLQEGPDPTGLLGVDPTELLNSLDNLDFNQLVMDLTDNNNQEPSTVVPMDTDEWLEALMPPSSSQDCPGGDLGLGYDPMLGMGQDTFDPFNLEEFRPPADIALPWDKVDYAT